MNEELKQLDKYGLCPNCKTSWDGGDILEEVTKLDVYIHKTYKELASIAENYGWTEFNKIRFTRLSTTIRADKTLYTCPEIRCAHVFDEEGNEYESLGNAVEGKIYTIDETTHRRDPTVYEDEYNEDDLNTEDTEDDVPF